MNSDARIALIRQVKQDRLDKAGFRWHAVKTQSVQDTHLQNYRAFTKVWKDMPEDATDADIDKLAFPADEEDLLENLDEFIIFTYIRVPGKKRRSGYIEMMSYNSLAAYRESMLFWCNRKLPALRIKVPARSKMFDSMTEAMRFVQKKYGSRRYRHPRAGLGLIELRQLLDHELTSCYSIELSEQHQVIWCIARQTACRPGSIGNDQHRPDQYLIWDDVVFERDKVTKRWNVIISFRHLKINYDDPEKNRGQLRILHCYLKAPNEDNLIFSVPHRLLTIALRRGLIDGLTTKEEVMASNLQRIKVKQECRHQPVFFRGTPGGRGIDMDLDENGSFRPLSSHAISSYLSDRGRALGYPEAHTVFLSPQDRYRSHCPYWCCSDS